MFTTDAHAIHVRRSTARRPIRWSTRRPAGWTARRLSSGAEELPQDGMHLHHLLPPDRLVHLDHDADGEQHARAGGITDRPDHVGARREGAHRGPAGTRRTYSD